jgi:hypothetical protein
MCRGVAIMDNRGGCIVAVSLGCTGLPVTGTSCHRAATVAATIAISASA